MQAAELKAVSTTGRDDMVDFARGTRSHALARGMSLIEMVVVIVLIGIIGTALGGFMLPAVQSYEAQRRRATLVDSAEAALRRMGRDVRIALPNSVRVTDPGTGASFALEIIPTADGGRYCTSGVADCTSNDVLDFSAADTVFDLLGCFRNSSFVGTPAGHRLVVGNTGSEVYTASGSPAVITPSATSLSISESPASPCGSGTNRHRVTLSSAHQFSAESSRQRVFVIKTSDVPVSYLCDASAGTLRRYAGYTIVDPQPTSAASLSGAASSGLVAENVTECKIKTSTQNILELGLVTFELSVASGGETVRLRHQVQLDNSL